jgi:hypothetical protein
MRLKPPSPATTVSRDNDQQITITPAEPSEPPLNAATRYMTAAAHLRKGMLPAEVSGASIFARPAPRAHHPVGRGYAMRALFMAERTVPMPGVDVGIVRRHCWTAMWQTLVRDIAALGVLIVAAILQPLGTLIAALIFFVLLMVMARRKVPSVIPTGITLAIVLAVVAARPSPRNPFFVPLIAFAGLFFLAAVDILWSAYRIRGIWKQTSAPATDKPGDVVFYNKHGFIGSGEAVRPLPLTVPLDKAKDQTIPVHRVTTGELLAYIGSHLASQGVSDGQPHGYAGDPATATSPPGQSAPAADGLPPLHFTYGLPYLDVQHVIAVPEPAVRKMPFLPFARRPLDYQGHPAAADMHRTVNKSPSDFPHRHYIRAITASWDGHLVVSVFVSAALQGHFLQVLIRPYLIAPIGAELKAADSVVGRSGPAVVLSCLAMTARQCLITADQIGDIARGGIAPNGVDRKTGRAESEPAKSGLVSIRERYAQPATENIYHSEDAARLITVIEEKVIRTTMRYLGSCNVDVNETEARIMTTFVQNTIHGAGNIVLNSTVNQSPMTATAGQGNVTTNVSGGPAAP